MCLVRPIVEEAQSLRANVDDFTVKTLIGKGYFGNVHLVIERQTNDVYAMKKIKKSVVTTSQVKEERDIMARRSSEWITNLQYAFQVCIKAILRTKRDTVTLIEILYYLLGY